MALFPRPACPHHRCAPVERSRWRACRVPLPCPQKHKEIRSHCKMNSQKRICSCLVASACRVAFWTLNASLLQPGSVVRTPPLPIRTWLLLCISSTYFCCDVHLHRLHCYRKRGVSMETEVVKWWWQSDVAGITPFEDDYKMEPASPLNSILAGNF